MESVPKDSLLEAGQQLQIMNRRKAPNLTNSCFPILDYSSGENAEKWALLSGRICCLYLRKKIFFFFFKETTQVISGLQTSAFCYCANMHR